MDTILAKNIGNTYYFVAYNLPKYLPIIIWKTDHVPTDLKLKNNSKYRYTC